MKKILLFVFVMGIMKTVTAQQFGITASTEKPHDIPAGHTIVYFAKNISDDHQKDAIKYCIVSDNDWVSSYYDLEIFNEEDQQWHYEDHITTYVEDDEDY